MSLEVREREKLGANQGWYGTVHRNNNNNGEDKWDFRENPVVEAGMAQATPPNLIDPAAAFNQQKLRANRSPVFVFLPVPYGVPPASWMYCYENTGVGLVESGAEVIGEQRGRYAQSNGENIGQRWTGPRQAGLHADRLPCDLSVLLVSCLAEAFSCKPLRANY